MLNLDMSLFSFEFVKNYFLQFPKYCWDFVTFSGSSRYSSRVEALRERYYVNASFLDRMAKTYGELNFFLKFLLLGSALSISILFIFNPLFFGLGISLLLIIDLLSIQFDAMEKRFKLMVEDIANLEKKLDKAMQENSQLKQTLDSSIEKNQLLITQLEESNEQIKNIESEMIQKRIRISNACDVIESSAQKVSEAATKYVEKTQHVIDSFTATPTVVEESIALSEESVLKSQEALSKSHKTLRETSQVNDYILSFMKEQGIEFNYSDSSQTLERAHSNRFFQRVDSSEGADNVTGYGVV
jgi:methyl-accepting chemotaxis protein